MFGWSLFRLFLLLLLLRFWQAFDEGCCGCSAVHAAALMRPAVIVADEIVVENGLHLLDGLEPGAASFDAEVLVEQGAVQAFDDAVRLRSPDPGGAVLDLFQLQEQLVGMPVGPAAELAAVVGQHGLDPGLVLLEGRDDIVVHQVHGGDRQLVGIESRPSVAAVAVDRGLQIDFADALEGADEEGVDTDETAGVRGLDVALAELRREALQQPGLLLGEFDLALGGGLFQPQQPLMIWSASRGAARPRGPLPRRPGCP